MNGKENGSGIYMDSQGNAMEGEWEKGKVKHWI